MMTNMALYSSILLYTKKATPNAMLKGMILAVAFAILVVGAAWLAVVAVGSIEKPVRTEIRYVPQPIPMTRKAACRITE
jgi:hypothetical protein